MIPIGLFLKQLIKQRGYTISEFARNIHCSRRTLYDIFNKNSIDTDLLILMSKELKINLFKELSQYVETYLEKDEFIPKKDKINFFLDSNNNDVTPLNFFIRSDKTFDDAVQTNNLWSNKKHHDVKEKIKKS